MQLLVLPDAKFTCSSCTNCCRDWHVELLAGEAEQISRLQWPADDELHQRKTLFPHSGKIYLAHRADGSCVFLNIKNGLCRIHEQFGESVKPLGCRLYPFQIVSTFNNQATVTARFDCPAVRQNVGQPHSEALPQLRRLERQLQLGDSFDAVVRNGYSGEQLDTICEFAGILIAGFASDAQRAMFLIHLADWLESTDPADVDRPRLAGQFPLLKSAVESDAANQARRPSILQRVVFRTVLGLYLRRDEDVLNGLAGRSARLFGMLAIVFGFGRLDALGRSHPRSRLRTVRLLRQPPAPTAPGTYDLCWQMIRDKLASLQFMGSANPNHDFMRGLRSLALLYPLISSVARCAAADRGGREVSAADVDRAVGIVEHAFGRSPVLAQPLVRSLETFLLQRQRFLRLVCWS